jgi:hypothetical protein
MRDDMDRFAIPFGLQKYTSKRPFLHSLNAVSLVRTVCTIQNLRAKKQKERQDLLVSAGSVMAWCYCFARWQTQRQLEWPF